MVIITEPWKDWIPGVLNSDQMQILVGAAHIRAPKVELDASSLDLHLSNDGYQMTRGSVKPTGEPSYYSFLENATLAKKLVPEQDGTYVLGSRQTYVFKLQEQLGRKLGEIGIHGQATAKSSLGRVDVLARLIVDGMDTYESFNPEGLTKQNGDLYLEITPMTFRVRVKPDISLSQLRLFYGRPDDIEIRRSPELFTTVFHTDNEQDARRDGSLTVDLSNTNVNGRQAAAFHATGSTTLAPVPLWKDCQDKPDPTRYWALEESRDMRLCIKPEDFYILRSKERISVPEGIAIYCKASDETIGEMRIHYAGFVHPFFGLKREDGRKGTPLIFEVRGHQVDVSLADGERLANLVFYRMSRDAKSETAPKGAKPDPYENQTLELSKFFDAWPTGKRKKKRKKKRNKPSPATREAKK